MELKISNNNSLPLYKQVYNQVKFNIINGELRQGDILPSIRQFAKTLNLSVITIKKAYYELERQGYIITRQGKGTYVSFIDLDKEFINNKINTKNKLKNLILESKSLGLKDEDIMNIVKKLLNTSLKNKRKLAS